MPVRYANRRRIAELERTALLNAHTAAGLTPLFVGAFSGHVEIVDVLLKERVLLVQDAAQHVIEQPKKITSHEFSATVSAEPLVNVNASNRKGATALYVAAQRGHARICALLIAAGADVACSTSYGNRVPTAVVDFSGYWQVIDAQC